jgi:7-carboxy-7-deazaguanine synthase
VLLADRLVASGKKVAIETSGAHALADLPAAVIRIVDVKTPSSGECEHVRWPLLGDLRACDAAKFVIANEADYRWSAAVVLRLGLAAHTEVLFSPVYGRLEARDLVAWIIRDRVPARVNLQLHKYVWGPEERGV